MTHDPDPSPQRHETYLEGKNNAFASFYGNYDCGALPMDSSEGSGEERRMLDEEAKSVVKDRYGKFAETGGRREAC